MKKFAAIMFKTSISMVVIVNIWFQSPDVRTLSTFPVDVRVKIISDAIICFYCSV